jgi:hypothetical protein
MRWQLDASSVWNYRDSGRSVTGFSGAGLQYLVSDRWYGIARVQHRSFGQRGSIGDWDLIWGADLDYWLEDSWSVGLHYFNRQSHRTDAFHRDATVSVGFTYRILGSLDAPALSRAQNLTR